MIDWHICISVPWLGEVLVYKLMILSVLLA